MNIEEAFAMAEDKGRLSARDFLDKMRTDYRWHVVCGASAPATFHVYIDEPEGFNCYLAPDLIEMEAGELQDFIGEFNYLMNTHTLSFSPSGNRKTDDATGTPES